MKSRRTLIAAIFVLVAGTFSLIAAAGEPRQSNFKNIQVLKDLSDGEIQRLMQSWARQLDTNCVGCHVQGDFPSDEKAEKKTARKMYEIVRLLNDQDFFKDKPQKADCYLCHKGSLHPERAPGR